MCTLNKYAKPCEWIESVSRHMFYKIDLSAQFFYFSEKSMIAHAALELKDAFAPQFASIHAILDSVEFLENFEVILANFSSSCFYVLSLSEFFAVFIFYYVRLIVWCIKCHKSVFVSNPDRLVNIWELGNVGSYTKPLNINFVLRGLLRGNLQLRLYVRIRDRLPIYLSSAVNRSEWFLLLYPVINRCQFK